MKNNASFTATNTADPEELLHSVCTMAFPVEGVALATVNDIIAFALASSELEKVGRWRLETCLIDIGNDVGLYTLIHHWCYELSSYNHLIQLTSYQ